MFYSIEKLHCSQVSMLTKLLEKTYNILNKSDYTYSNSNTLLKLVERMFDGNSEELARKTTKYVYDDNGNQLKQSVSHILPDNTKLILQQREQHTVTI